MNKHGIPNASHGLGQNHLERIRRMHANGVPKNWLREQYGLSKGQIKRILRTP